MKKLLSSLMFLLLLITPMYLSAGRCPLGGNSPPVASIQSYSVSSDGHKVTFSLKFSDPDGDSIVGWYFDFGDGHVVNKTTAPPHTLTHTYKHFGTYDIVFRVKDKFGAWSRPYKETIWVSPSNMPPKAVIEYAGPNPATVGQVITFKGYGVDPNGYPIKSWTWDFDDGKKVSGKGSTSQVTHAFSKPGVYIVRFAVKNSKNKWSTWDVVAVRVVTVEQQKNVPPTIQGLVFSPQNPKVNEQVKFVVSAIDQDGTVKYALWSFGDGTTQKDGVKVTHKYIQSGTYTVSVRVVDDKGATSKTYTVKVTVTGNKLPAATVLDLRISGLNVSLNGVGSDPDGQVVKFKVDWGDGQITEGELKGNGVPTGLLKHTYQSSGNYTLKFTVMDDQGAWSQPVIRSVLVKEAKNPSQVSLLAMLAAALVGTVAVAMAFVVRRGGSGLKKAKKAKFGTKKRKRKFGKFKAKRSYLRR